MTTELVPLRTGFDVAWLGYRRDQVQHYVDVTERDFELLAADRDAAEARALSLARTLDAAREENRALRDRIERLCRQPLSPDSVGERLRHAVDAALAEASAIVERASAVEDHVWASARQTHAEHRDLLATTRERMSRLVREGEARRRALDDAAERHRAQVAEDFELALALRRKETLRDARLIEETARMRAERSVREAARQVEVLREHRDRVADVLRVVHALLGKAAGHLQVDGGAFPNPRLGKAPPSTWFRGGRVVKILPLALAQFIASYAATNMNVAISTIADDLGTTITGVQTSITLFTLVMAALMVPGSKLTDLWGRRRCFVLGLTVYGTGALLAALAPGPGLLLVGYALLEGIGSALMIPPIYILVTALATDPTARAKGFGAVSGAGGLGAAAGPLLGGLITSTFSWRASFLLQVLVVAVIILLARSLPRTGGTPGRFDLLGAFLSGAGLFLLVLGALRTNVNGWQLTTWLFIGAGAVVLTAFAIHIRRTDNPLCEPKLFQDRTSNLGLGTQLVQWLVLQGTFFVLSVHLQQEQHLSAIETGLALLPATIGMLVTSALAGRFARRYAQRTLIRAGFVLTIAGTLQQPVGLFLLGAGIGIMLTASVNVVQSRWPDADQADVSGVSRAVSNLGSSLGTALVGSVLTGAGHPYRAALTLLVLFSVVGLGFALFIRSDGEPRRG